MTELYPNLFTYIPMYRLGQKIALHEVKRDYCSDSFFFQSTRTEQNSSAKFYEMLWCQIEPFGLTN